MRRKLCELCHKKPVVFTTRKDKDSPKVHICESCVPHFKGAILVSYNKESS